MTDPTGDALKAYSTPSPEQQMVGDPYAAMTIDCSGCEHMSRDVGNIEAIAEAGSHGPTEVIYLYAAPAPVPHVDAIAALREAEPYVEILHSLVTAKDTRAEVWRVLKKVRAALEAEGLE